jgi:hypothetical protein
MARTWSQQMADSARRARRAERRQRAAERRRRIHAIRHPVRHLLRGWGLD